MTQRRRRTGEPLHRRRSDQGIAWLPLIAIVAALGSAGLVANQSGVSPAQSPQSGTQIFRTFSPAIAVIEATSDNGSVLRFGSAVWLGQRQVLVTNAHVVVGPGRIGARFGSDSFPPSELEVLYVDIDADLAVLKLARVPGRMPVIQLRISRPPEIGEKVFAIGNPQGLERTLSEGVISGIRSLTGIASVVQHTAPISSGSSGGALFNASGELIGLTVAYLEGGQNLNFAIPAAGIGAAVDQALDVPNDREPLAAFVGRTRRRFPGLYDGLDDQSIMSRLRSRYPALGAVLPPDTRQSMPAQLYAFAATVSDILGEYNEQAAKIDIFADPRRVVELQALNRRRLTRLRLLQPSTAGTRSVAQFLIAGCEETERRLEYYTSAAMPTRSADTERALLRNEVQYAADGFRALVLELAPYREAAPNLHDWAQESYDRSQRLLDTLKK